MKSNNGLMTALACLSMMTACGLDGLTSIDEPGEGPPSDSEQTTPDEPPAPWRAPECEAAINRDSTFSFGNGGRSQLAPSLAFNGRLYASWSQPPADSNNSQFDVRARVVGCDLAPVSDAVTLNDDPDVNHTSSRIVATSDGALVAWSATGGTNPYPAVKMRGLDRSGTPTGDEFSPFGSQAAWMPDVALLPNGNVGLASARSIDETPFRATFQEVSPCGELVGQTHAAPTSNHSNPAVAATSGAIHLAWGRDDDFGATAIESARVIEDGVGVASLLASGRNGDYPRASGWLGEAGRAWAVFSSSLDGVTSILLHELGGAPQTELGFNGRTNIAPVVAASADGGAVAWITMASGTRTLVAQRFRAGGAGVSTSAPVTIPTGSVYQAQPALVHLSGDDFAIAWSEGAYPAYELKLRIVELK